jgi:hypothetical protein
MPRDINICIDTSQLPLAARSETSSNFTVDFPTSIILGSMDWFLSLTSLSTWNSFHNLSSKYFNNVFTVTQPGPINTVITVPNGRYSFEDFKTFFDSLAPAGIATFTVNNNTGKFRLVVAVGCQLTMTRHSAFNFGFLGGERDNSTTVTFTAGTTESIVTPQWSNGITSLLFSCDLTSNSSLNGGSSNVIAQFNPRAAPFASIVFEPINRLYMQVNKKEITRIKCRITDQSNRLVDLEGEDVVITLTLRQF